MHAERLRYSVCLYSNVGVMFQLVKILSESGHNVHLLVSQSYDQFEHHDNTTTMTHVTDRHRHARVHHLPCDDAAISCSASNDTSASQLVRLTSREYNFHRKFEWTFTEILIHFVYIIAITTTVLAMDTLRERCTSNMHQIPAFCTSMIAHQMSHGAFTHTVRWDGMGSDGMSCAGNSMYFNGGVHTLSYQSSPSHPISSRPVPSHPVSSHRSVCVNALLRLNSTAAVSS